MNLEEIRAISGQLAQFVDFFADQFGRSERRHWCHLYLCGLILNGERKSIQPMAERLPGGNEQALQQFVNQSPWDHSSIMAKLVQYLADRHGSEDGILILDDTSV